MDNRIQNGASIILAICAVVAVVTMLRGRSEPPPPPPPGTPPVSIQGWTDLVDSGRRIGPEDARIVLVEFGDFECPVCGSYERRTLAPFLDKHHGQAALVFRHWPLDYHRLAYPAARASECAAEQGRFPEFHAVLYQKQDSLGLKSFRSMADESGVPDLERFDTCAGRSGPVERIDRDVEEAKRRGGSGTPTIFVNGYRYFGLPTLRQLDSILVSSPSGINQ